MEPTQADVTTGTEELRNLKMAAPYRFSSAVMLWRHDYNPPRWRAYSTRQNAIASAKRAKFSKAIIIGQ